MGLTRNLNETITYWRVIGDNGFGGYVFARPITMKARYSQSQEKYLTETGEEVISLAVVHLESDVITGDWIALGIHLTKSDPTALNKDGEPAIYSAHRVRRFTKVPDLRNSENNRKAYI